MSWIKWIGRQVREAYQVSDKVARGKAVETLEVELGEMENVFSLLVLGAFVGLPSPPMQISLDLMPHMERELIKMTQEVDTAVTPISRLFSTFDIG
ncbi:MAG: hypothetical protein GXP47_02255 [Acidobacteria bacterium]|nr:hypothetical protein [Acidobacteriota bacterium]